MATFDLLLMGFVLIIASFVATMIHIPFIGALVRFRCNYTPKGLQLDSEGQAQPYVGPVISNYFAMLARIKRIEGWSGFWKGSMPTFASTGIVIAFVFIIGATMSTLPGGTYNVEVTSPFKLLIFTAFLALLSTPFTVVINRAITTPHKLPWFSPLRSLQILLTPSEMHRPWTLYTAPGLLLARALHVGWLVLIQRGVRNLLLPNLKTDPNMSGEDTGTMIASLPPFWVALYLVFIGISSIAVLTPLEVISTRLSVQRNHGSGSGGFGAVPQEDDELAALEYAGKDEDVIALRPEETPYEGFVHCGKSILQEEGPATLLRAWWLTLIVGVLGAFS